MVEGSEKGGESGEPHSGHVVIEDTSELHIQKPNILAVECQTDTFKANISFDDF